MGNITSGQVYTISTQTADGEIRYLTAGFGDANLRMLISPHGIYQTDPTQAWMIKGDSGKAQLQSGLIADPNYTIHFYLTNDIELNVFSATSDPLNVTYWSITDADNN